MIIIHVYLYDQNGRLINSGWLRLLNGDNYFSRTTIDKYLQSPSKDISNYMFWGKIKDRNIGYIYPESFYDYNIENLDLLIEKVKNYSAIIIDNRNNRGGSAAYAWRLSSWFSDNDDIVVYTQFRNGPLHNNFSSKKEHRNYIRKNNLSNIPVILLTNRGTVSAAEWFTLSMKTFKNVIQIGDTTVGAYSTISPICFLSNGWKYYYSIHKVLLPNGTSPEGRGSAPDIYVTNTYEILNNEKRDLILEQALKYLHDNFNL